jgi:hypothetical protein
MEPGHSANSEEVRQGTGRSDGASPDQPPFYTFQDIKDLPQRLLPEETVTHLKNAGREALMAVYTLWRSIDTTRQGQSGKKVRKHIDVE